MRKQYLKNYLKTTLLGIFYHFHLWTYKLTCVFIKQRKKATATILYSFYGGFSACEFTSKSIKKYRSFKKIKAKY